ncbi:hypothetical protein D3C85_451890 [compost metagenome]
MKKILLLFVVFAAQLNFAQNVFPTNGNVGVGTSSPLVKLEVNSIDVAAFFKSTTNSVPVSIMSATTPVCTIGFKGSTSVNEFNVRVGADGNDLISYTNNIERMRINSIGNVGIGTNTPNSLLSLNKASSILGDPQSISLYEDDLANYGFTVNAARGGMDFCANQAAAGTSFRWFGGTNKSAPKQLMALLGNGNLGIGTESPDAKLAVNGTIHSKEVKVDISGWPDYVFKKEYDLPTLAEVEKHIAEKGHLENIPSEEEVIKNGVNLGEMNAKLLQKIEEMTLYMIEMKKENEIVKNENKLMKENQIELERRILKIENK